MIIRRWWWPWYYHAKSVSEKFVRPLTSIKLDTKRCLDRKQQKKIWAARAAQFMTRINFLRDKLSGEEIVLEKENKSLPLEIYWKISIFKRFCCDTQVVWDIFFNSQSLGKNVVNPLWQWALNRNWNFKLGMGKGTMGSKLDLKYCLMLPKRKSTQAEVFSLWMNIFLKSCRYSKPLCIL